MQEKLIDLLINNTLEVLLAVLNYLKIVSEEYLLIRGHLFMTSAQKSEIRTPSFSIRNHLISVWPLSPRFFSRPYLALIPSFSGKLCFGVFLKNFNNEIIIYMSFSLLTHIIFTSFMSIKNWQKRKKDSINNISKKDYCTSSVSIIKLDVKCKRSFLVKAENC